MFSSRMFSFLHNLIAQVICHLTYIIYPKYYHYFIRIQMLDERVGSGSCTKINDTSFQVFTLVKTEVDFFWVENSKVNDIFLPLLRVKRGNSVYLVNVYSLSVTHIFRVLCFMFPLPSLPPFLGGRWCPYDVTTRHIQHSTDKKEF